MPTKRKTVKRAKLVRNRSTPELDRWWASVEQVAAAAPELKYEEPRQGRTRRICVNCGQPWNGRWGGRR